MSTDNEIIRRSLEHPAAFAQLFDRHHATIHRFVARRLDGHAADDLMSETFLVAFEARGRFDLERSDALPWLYGIVTTLMRKHRRLEARAWRALEAASGAEPVDEPDDARLEAGLELARLAASIRRLPRGDRDALLLYAWADLDYQGVADALGVPIGTVRSRLNRARRTLRAASGRPAAEEVGHGRDHSAALGA